MKQFQDSTNSTLPAGDSTVAPLIMDVVPLVMNYIRTWMRNSRTTGLTVPQFRALVFLYRHEEASLSEVSEHLGLKLPTTSKTIEALVTRKLVIRRNYSADRRRVSLRLSSLGLAELKRARKSTETRLAEILAELTPEQQSAIAASLTVLRPFFTNLNKTPNNNESLTRTPGGSHG